MKTHHYVLVGLSIVIGLVAIVGFQFFGKTYEFQGSLIAPPIPAADFELTDQNGETFQLSEHIGEVVLIFFGYTNCPDVCPVTLSEFKQVKAQLGEKADRVQFVYITVDPERDTVERISEHLENFDPTFVGLTGDNSELDPVWKAYGVYAAKVDTGSAAGYLVDHTARVYAIDVNGNLRLTYPFETGSDAIADDVLHLLGEEIISKSGSS
jgi:protein SCO1/2